MELRDELKGGSLEFGVNVCSGDQDVFEGSIISTIVFGFEIWDQTLVNMYDGQTLKYYL